MSEATPYTPVTLTGTQSTSPFDLRTVADTVVLTCAVTGTVAYTIEVSNDERSSRAYISIGAYTASIVKRLRGAMPRYMRVRMTSGSGSVDVALGKAINQDGKLSEVNFDSRHVQ